MKITLIKQLNNTFKLAYPSDYDNAKKIPLNEPFEYKYKMSRNLGFHKKFFALINMLFDNQEQFTNKDFMRKQLTIEAGYFTEEVGFHGEVIKEAISISFASMDEIEFQEYYNRFIDTIVRLYKWDRQDLVDNVLQYF